MAATTGVFSQSSQRIQQQALISISTATTGRRCIRLTTFGQDGNHRCRPPSVFFEMVVKVVENSSFEILSCEIAWKIVSCRS